VENNIMALFTRTTKTRVWGTKGKITIKAFMNADKEKSITIKLNGYDGKTHSITIYGEEVDHLQYLMSKSFEQQ
jgi:hypothetical protein